MFMHECILSHVGTFTYTKIEQYSNMYESQRHYQYAVKNIIIKDFIPGDPNIKPRPGQVSWDDIQE